MIILLIKTNSIALRDHRECLLSNMLNYHFWPCSQSLSATTFLCKMLPINSLMRCSFHVFSLFAFQWSSDIPLNPARSCQASLSVDLRDVEAMIAIIFSVCVFVVFTLASFYQFFIFLLLPDYFFLNLPLQLIVVLLTCFIQPLNIEACVCFHNYENPQGKITCKKKNAIQLIVQII